MMGGEKWPVPSQSGQAEPTHFGLDMGQAFIPMSWTHGTFLAWHKSGQAGSCRFYLDIVKKDGENFSMYKFECNTNFFTSCSPTFHEALFG